jgi:hypothetical protein
MMGGEAEESGPPAQATPPGLLPAATTLDGSPARSAVKRTTTAQEAVIATQQNTG